MENDWQSERKMLYQQLERANRRIKELSTVLEISASLYSTMDLSETLGAVMKMTCDLLQAEGGSIMLLDPKRRELYVAASKGIAQEIAERTRVKVGEGIAGWLAEVKDPILVFDVETDPRFRRRNLPRYATKSFASAPLILSNDELAGIINVSDKANGEPFDFVDLDLLISIAQQASVFVERIMLYEEMQRDMRRLETSKRIIEDVNRMLDRKLMDMTLLNMVDRAASASLDLKNIVIEIAKILSKVIACEICAFLSLASGEEELIVVSRDFYQPTIERFIADALAKASESMGREIDPDEIGIVWENGLIPDVGGKRDSFNIHLERVSVSQNVIGALYIAHSSYEFSDEDRRIFSMLAGHAAMALQNAILVRKLEELSITDGLTRVHTHRYFREILDQEIKRMKELKRDLSLIMVDIDDFKRINDTYGHPFGDKVLIGVAQSMKHSLRELDTIARYGGEEFIIILPGADSEIARTVAERLRQNIAKLTFKTRDDAVKITVSLGTCTFKDSMGLEEFIERADRALYAAKKGGKNRVISFGDM
ncbi:MAG: diguanylate cyclase [bacterium]